MIRYNLFETLKRLLAAEEQLTRCRQENERLHKLINATPPPTVNKTKGMVSSVCGRLRIPYLIMMNAGCRL
jgi:hypothetical protein